MTQMGVSTVPAFQGGIEGSGKTGGLHQNWCIQLDDGLSGPAGGFGPMPLQTSTARSFSKNLYFRPS